MKRIDSWVSPSSFIYIKKVDDDEYIYNLKNIVSILCFNFNIETQQENENI
jgi:hypothetical protein